jgi:hypothetical protein
MKPLRPGEIAVMVPLVALTVLMGVYPAPFTETMKVSVEATLEVPDAPTAYARHARSHVGPRAPETASASPAGSSCESPDRPLNEFVSDGCSVQRGRKRFAGTGGGFRNASRLISEGAAR